ncbi:unnamed protein product, partial [Timema podura]|nr:unnamed protein product [Timema podura]
MASIHAIRPIIGKSGQTRLSGALAYVPTNAGNSFLFRVLFPKGSSLNHVKHDAKQEESGCIVVQRCRHPQMTPDKMSVTSQQQSPPPASTPPPDPPVEVVHEIIETGAARKRDEPPALPPRPPPRSRQPPGSDIVEECGGLPIQPCLPPR